jgi:hypothetical protein
MSKVETYLYEREVLAGEVAQVLAMYRDDPGAAHVKEDELLERFIRDAAWGLDHGVTKSSLRERAMVLCELLDARRQRWFG